MKKKFLALALSLTMVLGLAACGGGSDNASSDGSSAAAGDSGSSTVVVAMGSGFSTLDPGYVYEKYPPMIVKA